MNPRQTQEVNWPAWFLRGAVGGVVAGGAFLAATMWFAPSVGDPAKGPLLMISTVVQGEDAMMDGTASVGVGIALHVVLSAIFGVVFAVLASRLRTNGTLALAGTLFGAALYLVNFKILSPLAFEVFEMANQPFELVVHMVFGTLLSFALFRLPEGDETSSTLTENARRRSPPTRGWVEWPPSRCPPQFIARSYGGSSPTEHNSSRCSQRPSTTRSTCPAPRHVPLKMLTPPAVAGLDVTGRSSSTAGMPSET